MPNRLRNVSRRSSPPNRSWAGFRTNAPIAVPANTKILLSTLGLSNPGIDETVLRNVGIISIVTDQVVAGEQQIGAFGMVKVSTIAATAGAASIPGPITDASADGWFTYVPFAQEFQFISAVGVAFNAATQYQFDSKAKRRVNTGFALAMMVENAHATHGFFISVVLRTLSQVTGT